MKKFLHYCKTSQGKKTEKSALIKVGYTLPSAAKLDDFFFFF